MGAGTARVTRVMRERGFLPGVAMWEPCVQLQSSTLVPPGMAGELPAEARVPRMRFGSSYVSRPVKRTDRVLQSVQVIGI